MILYPKAYFLKVEDITIEFLRKKKLKALILDVDNTLIDYEENLSSTKKQWAKELRENGIKAGLLKIRVFRPFPTIEIANALSKLKAVAILDRADSLNNAGGALFEDITSAMYTQNIHVPMVNYIYGIGGRDTKSTDIESVYSDLQKIVETGNIDNPYRYLGLRKEEN